MPVRPIVPGLYAISLGFVNVFLLDTGSGLALFDAGIPGSGRHILRAVAELGHPPAALRAILITHLHQDHVGGLAEIQRASGAAVYMHALEAADYRRGLVLRPVEPAPGLLNRLMVRAVTARPSRPAPVEAQVDVELRGGEEIAAAGGVRAIHTPGHTAGHLAYYWPQQGGVLIAGDMAGHMFRRLNYSILYESFDQGRRTLAAIPSLGFQVACFAHGGPILRNAAQAFAARFSSPNM